MRNLNQESTNFFIDIVSRMKIRFEEPEARIIVQNDNRIDSKSNYMFFIERGECIVQINDKDKCVVLLVVVLFFIECSLKNVLDGRVLFLNF